MQNADSNQKNVSFQRKRIVSAVIKRVLLLLIALLIVFFGFSYYQLYTYQARLVNVLQFKGMEDQALQVQQEKMQKKDLSPFKSNIKSDQSQAVNPVFQKSPCSSVLLESIYLMRLAEINLYQHNNKAALQLLSKADAKIKQQRNPKFQAVLEQLSLNINALKTMPKVDFQMVYQRLQAIDIQLDKLPMADQSLISSEKSSHKKSPPKSGWRDMLHAGWESLNKAIVIRHSDQEIIPLTDVQRDLVRLNLHLLFMQSQSALTQKQLYIYRSSLSRAKQLILKYYGGRDVSVKKLLDELETLKNKPLFGEMPDISKTLDALEDVYNATLNECDY